MTPSLCQLLKQTSLMFIIGIDEKPEVIL